MSKKTLGVQRRKMLVAALFTMLCVGIYAGVDRRVERYEGQRQVLGSDTGTIKNFFQLVWCRLKYGVKCEQSKVSEKTMVDDKSMSVDSLIDRELKNLENEVKTDRGEDQNSSYWSM